jgi:ankyrin repeat protein
VYCQVVYLCGCLPGRIRQALAELPETLDETYERTLREIKKINMEIAHRLLQCVAVAFRPLRVDELAEFLAFDFTSKPIPTFHEGWRLEDPMEAVLSTCSTLLVIVDVKDEYHEPKKVIQFSHFSVKEYLTSDRLAESSDVIARRYHISMTPTHTLAAQACLGLLLHLDESVFKDNLENTPLVQYAAEHWVDHALFEGVSQNVEDGMKLLFDPGSPHLRIWVRIHDPRVGGNYWDTKPSRINGTPLHFAAVCGFHAIVKFLVTEHSQDVCAVEIDMLTPLHLASGRGHLKVTQFLVEHDADVTAQDINGMTPLHLTSRGGHLEVARFLVEHNADISAHDVYGSTPLQLASQKEGNVEVARFLVERGADPTAQNMYGLTPLHLASFEGDMEFIHFILEHGADLTTQTKDGLTPLHLALRPWHR